MNEYLENLNRNNRTNKFDELETFAKEHNTPIIQYDSLMTLLLLIKVKNVKKILEIGTAIGYSASQMANVSKYIVVDTIERDEQMYQIATNNIKKLNLETQINIHNFDALEIPLDKLSLEYDLIFIDAAKSQYQKFFDRFIPLLNKNGIVVTDNILFHGCVESSLKEENDLSKNVRNMARKINVYNNQLSNMKDFETIYLDCGDGLAITMRKQND